MRLGLYGGSFDPVHYGHLLLAEQCREQCRLDQVWFIPAGTPPHKQDHPITPGPQRADMLEFAISGQPAFAVKRMELERSGPSYTVDTLRQVRNERPDDELFLLIGTDSLVDLPHWYQPQEIVSLATLAVANRGDQPWPDLASLVPHLGEAAVDNLQRVEMPGCAFASRDLRRRVAAGQSIRYLTPRAVEQFIFENGLYRSIPHDDA